MAKPDRAARVAGRETFKFAGLNASQQALLRKSVARAIRREVKRAVEEEREICVEIATDPMMIDRAGGSTGNAYGTAKRIAAAIRARGKK